MIRNPVKCLCLAVTAVAPVSGVFADAVSTARLGSLHPKNGIVVTNVDFSAGNTQLVATIEATAPAPGNYVSVSNAAMSVSPLMPYALKVDIIQGESVSSGEMCERTLNFGDTIIFAFETNGQRHLVFYESKRWYISVADHDIVEGSASAWDMLGNDMAVSFDTQSEELGQCSFHAYYSPVATLSDISSQVGAAVSPQVVTNIVHDLSLGGIWDSTLEVWWTPRMCNGSLTYEATTNVNLNAEGDDL